MLAEMYTRQFGDLPEAERTVLAVCDQPNVTSVQISVALDHLADWQLNLGNDPAGAARALDEICRRLPGSHFAKMAQQRKRQLPGSRQELLEQREPRSSCRRSWATWMKRAREQAPNSAVPTSIPGE